MTVCNLEDAGSSVKEEINKIQIHTFTHTWLYVRRFMSLCATEQLLLYFHLLTTAQTSQGKCLSSIRISWWFIWKEIFNVLTKTTWKLNAFQKFHIFLLCVCCLWKHLDFVCIISLQNIFIRAPISFKTARKYSCSSNIHLRVFIQKFFFWFSKRKKERKRKKSFSPLGYGHCFVFFKKGRGIWSHSQHRIPNTWDDLITTTKTKMDTSLPPRYHMSDMRPKDHQLLRNKIHLSS